MAWNCENDACGSENGCESENENENVSESESDFGENGGENDDFSKKTDFENDPWNNLDVKSIFYIELIFQNRTLIVNHLSLLWNVDQFLKIRHHFQ